MINYRLVFGWVLLGVVCLCGTGGALLASPAVEGRNTVVVVSVDGVRPDYLDRAETPHLDRLRLQGAVTGTLVPTFPTSTFASHATLATGANAETHGITGNSFYDSRTRQWHRYPGDAVLLEAEPIWITASRQGVRTLVYDWVLAHNQTGATTSAYFLPEYTRGISDRERLQRVLDTWESDTALEPLRLLFAYTESPDKEGHRHGPDSGEVEIATTIVDGLLAEFHYHVVRLWRRTAEPKDQLYFLVLSDHGMSPVHTAVNLRNAAGLENRDAVVSVTTANVGHLFFDRIRSRARREQWMQEAETALAEHPFLTVYRRENLPERWGFAHPHRTGDLVVVLPTGYTFSARPEGATAESGTLRGMHGYDPEEDPNMKTIFFLHRYPEPIQGRDLGEISTLAIHALIAELLGIKPADTASIHGAILAP